MVWPDAAVVKQNWFRLRRRLGFGQLRELVRELSHRQRYALLRSQHVSRDRAGRDVTLAALPLGVFTGGLPVLTGAFAGLTICAGLTGLTVFASLAGGLAVLSGLAILA